MFGKQGRSHLHVGNRRALLRFPARPQAVAARRHGDLGNLGGVAAGPRPSARLELPGGRDDVVMVTLLALEHQKDDS